jgi:hypothetical protein
MDNLIKLHIGHGQLSVARLLDPHSMDPRGRHGDEDA